MSHFAAVVVGDNYEEQLAPFHEFECTGDDNEFVQDIDRTEEARAEYARSTESRLRLPDGRLVSPFDDQFYRDPTFEEAKHVGFGTGFGGGLAYHSKDWGDGKGYRAKVRFVPEGAVEVEVPTHAVESLAVWIEGYYGWKPVPLGTTPDLHEVHKYGYAVFDADGQLVKAIDRTNPRAKWDWYQLGGRYSGWFKPKPEPALAVVGTGRDPFFGKTPLRHEDGVDQLRRGDLDAEGMREEARARAVADWDTVHAVLAQHPPVTPWPEVLTQFGIDPDSPDEGRDKLDEARKRYNEQPAIVALHTDKAARDLIFWGEGVERLLVSREVYGDRAANQAGVPFAFVKDGQWHERGEMGSWAMVANEKDRDAWTRQYWQMIDGLSDDTLLTLVDCHI